MGRTVRVRIGEPVRGGAGRATKEAVASLTARVEEAMLELVADGRDRRAPGPFGRWLTELFNDWPEGGRPDLGAGDAAGTDLASRRATPGVPAR